MYVTTSSTVWLSARGTSYVEKAPCAVPRHTETVRCVATDRPCRQALSYSRVSTNSRWPSASAEVSLPLAVRNMHSSSASPAWSGDISLRNSPETSTSICSLIVRTVRGLAQSLITGRIGLPITLPWPVGKKCTVYPAAAQSVTISAAAEMVTLCAASGFVVHFFPTGQGNVIGNPILPVIKICANARTVRTMSEYIDVDTSGLLQREITMSEAGDKLIDMMFRTANGRLTAAEALGHREFVLTRLYESA